MASLLSLPIELRLQIFANVFSIQQTLPGQIKDSMVKEYNECPKDANDADGRFIANAKRPTLFMRNVDPLHFRQVATLTWPCWRTVYDVRCDRFRARILQTTYQCMNITSFGQDLRLMLSNHQLHVEAARLFYGGFTFDFDTHIEAIVPFLADLTPFSRSCIKSISLIKRALPYEKEYDRAEWSNTMHYLSNPKNNMYLHCIHIGIVAGRPGEHGWNNVIAYAPGDFNVLLHTDSMSWLKELVSVPVQEIDPYAVIEHCPPASNSTAMAEYIKFSASIETGLALWLQDYVMRR